MSTILLAIYLIIVGCRHLFGIDIPLWVDGILAFLAGITMLVGRWVPSVK